MSVWHHFEITVLAKNREAVAKFFNFDNPEKDIRGYGDRFKLSFGGNYGPSLNIRKIIQQNPDLIFLTNESVEVDTEMWYVSRFDSTASDFRGILIQDFGSVTNKLSKKLLEEYNEKYPTWVNNHLEGKRGQDKFLWDSFLSDFNQMADRLNRAEEYKEMVNPWKHFNIKNYLLEYECNYGHGDQPHFIKEWQGPHPIAKIESIKEDFARRVKEGKLDEGDIRNISVREVEPK